MTFTTPNGTSGATMRPNRMMRWLIGRQVKAIRNGRSQMMGTNVLVLVTRGRKTGTVYETPVACWPNPDGSWLICASGNGAAKHPAWYRNLAAAPDASSAVIAGEDVPLHAQELHGDERAEAWQRIVTASPRIVGYTRKTDRELPVILISRRSDRPAG